MFFILLEVQGHTVPYLKALSSDKYELFGWKQELPWSGVGGTMTLAATTVWNAGWVPVRVGTGPGSLICIPGGGWLGSNPGTGGELSVVGCVNNFGRELHCDKAFV